ncbi:hypothetical protein AKJ37_04750 [candidate division MSBL1 archaeon SCGC-AAA259I09]|uniref:Protein containing YHS domain protein n=1 Tax=candidate division MSBL1 archaeon SCGC-AAA259I09 TaxID=1698267 RepID=A0A133UQV8_9EURY|nr:hypothetical protein AKJ37_04750 [candidate division MSBL1 archaeon SCGC-AAA259I09]
MGVIGSSEENAKGRDKAERIGREIAKRKCALLTGGCTGLPYAAVEGAKDEGGTTMGVSPASSRKEHREKYRYPVEDHDVLIFTGAGYKGRNVVLVRSCDAVIATSGRMGTLNELTIAYGEMRVMGLLKGVPGASDEFEKLAEKLGRPGREIVAHEDPEKLVEGVFEKLERA